MNEQNKTIVDRARALLGRLRAAEAERDALRLSPSLRTAHLLGMTATLGADNEQTEK